MPCNIGAPFRVFTTAKDLQPDVLHGYVSSKAPSSSGLGLGLGGGVRVRVRVRVRKEMTYAHNFRKTPNQMYVIGIWGKSGQGKSAHGTEF